MTDLYVGVSTDWLVGVCVCSLTHSREYWMSVKFTYWSFLSDYYNDTSTASLWMLNLIGYSSAWLDSLLYWMSMDKKPLED